MPYVSKILIFCIFQIPFAPLLFLLQNLQFLVVLGVTQENRVCVSTRINFRGTDYEVGAFVVTDFEKATRMPSFGEIKRVIYIDNEWVLFVRKVNTVRFCKLLQSFEVELSDDFHITSLTDLYDFHPIDCHKFASKYYVFMHYQLF